MAGVETPDQRWLSTIGIQNAHQPSRVQSHTVPIFHKMGLQRQFFPKVHYELLVLTVFGQGKKTPTLANSSAASH